MFSQTAAVQDKSKKMTIICSHFLSFSLFLYIHSVLFQSFFIFLNWINIIVCTFVIYMPLVRLFITVTNAVTIITDKLVSRFSLVLVFSHISLSSYDILSLTCFFLFCLYFLLYISIFICTVITNTVTNITDKLNLFSFKSSSYITGRNIFIPLSYAVLFVLQYSISLWVSNSRVPAPVCGKHIVYSLITIVSYAT